MPGLTFLRGHSLAHDERFEARKTSDRALHGKRVVRKSHRRQNAIAITDTVTDAVTVPAAMHLAQDVELLELSGLLRQQAARVGVLGIVELPDGLILVCDPRQLMARAEQQASP